MKNSNTLLTLLLLSLISTCLNAQVKMNFEFKTPYGHNKSVGKYILINEAKIYFEEYGKGEPLLLIHGNGGDIKAMGNQIDFFKSKYRVIIPDCRGQGKSELNTDSLTYDQITNDIEALVTYLKLDSIYIIGWSDGGIVGLKMGISAKTKIKKIVAMGSNIRPGSTAVYPWVIKADKEERKLIESMILIHDTSQNWFLKKQLLGLLEYQPTITTKALAKIKAKVLIIAGDEDLIKGEHSLEIYQNIPLAQLCIMPGETHFAPASNPELFNAIVNRFLSKSFSRPYSDWTK